MRILRLLSLIAAVILILFSIACSKNQDSTMPASEESAPGPAVDAAAMVNGKPVPMSELESAVRNIIIQNGMDADNLEMFMGQFGPRILDRLVESELLFQAAVKGGFVVTEEEIDAAYADLSGQYDEPSEFISQLEARGFTESTLKTSIRKQMSVQKYIQETIVPQAQIPEETVRKAYDQNPQKFSTQDTVQASHILIKSAESDPQDKKDEALKKAGEIADQAREDGADFALLAREHSEGPSASAGGELGYFSRGQMVKPFEEAAFSMNVNDISDPVLTRFGYHIIKVTDRKEGSAVSFDEIKEKLKADLKNRMISELVGKELVRLKNEASIEVLYTPPPQPAPGGASQAVPVK